MVLVLGVQVAFAGLGFAFKVGGVSFIPQGKAAPFHLLVYGGG